MIKKILILQHEDMTPPGSTLKWLQNHQISFEILRADKMPHLPKITFPISGIIICGGTQNIDQERDFPWLKNEKAFIKDCLSKKIPILGLCLGAQLIANALDAKVFKAKKWEYGWQEIQFFPSITSDWKDLFTGTRRIFQAHGYQFELPKICHPIASSAACEFQGFYTSNILAFQFHPEVNENWIQLSLQGFVPSGEYCQSSEEINRDNPLFIQKNEDWYFQILNRFFLK